MEQSFETVFVRLTLDCPITDAEQNEVVICLQHFFDIALCELSHFTLKF